MKRSLILCKADEGLTDQQVAEALMVGPSTVGRVRQHFVEGGWSAPSMTCRGRDNGANLMESRKPTWWPWPAAHPRKGTPRWTLRLLADQAVKLELTGSISRETVRQVLKKRTQALAEKGVVHPKGERRVRSLHGGRAGPLRGTL